MAMVPNEFGHLPPNQVPDHSQFLTQSNQPQSQIQPSNQQTVSSTTDPLLTPGRSNSPSEFLSNPNFNESQHLQNEGLVW